MMPDKKSDDLEAVRILVNTLEPFDKGEQERVIRWAREKLNLPLDSPTPPPTPPTTPSKHRGGPEPDPPPGTQNRDIKSFVAAKGPRSDTHFAATVAYYYQFEAPEAQRKDFITAENLLEACRQTGRQRLGNPGQTLRNAHHGGLMDQAGERGNFQINTVGENLVAMTLPTSPGKGKTTNKKNLKKKAKKISTKKKSSKTKR